MLTFVLVLSLVFGFFSTEVDADADWGKITKTPYTLRWEPFKVPYDDEAYDTLPSFSPCGSLRKKFVFCWSAERRIHSIALPGALTHLTLIFKPRVLHDGKYIDFHWFPRLEFLNTISCPLSGSKNEIKIQCGWTYRF